MKLGLIGAGKMGRIYCKDHNFAWIMDPVLKCDHVSMSMLREVDGVVVASPTKTHAAYITLLASSGIPVLVEKPMVSSLESAEHIAKKGWDVFVSQPVRYDWPEMPDGLDRICRESKGGPEYISPLWDLAVHDLDILQFWGVDITPTFCDRYDSGWTIDTKGGVALETFWADESLRCWSDSSGYPYPIPNSGTAIARQLEDFMVYLSSGQAPERLCTAKQALNVIRVIDSIQNGTS